MHLLSEEKSLPQKISEDIIALILEENLQPGDKLPNETILSERLNAGRSSVREAMKLLASRNIVTIDPSGFRYLYCLLSRNGGGPSWLYLHRQQAKADQRSFGGPFSS